VRYEIICVKSAVKFQSANRMARNVWICRVEFTYFTSWPVLCVCVSSTQRHTRHRGHMLGHKVWSLSLFLSSLLSSLCCYCTVSDGWTVGLVFHKLVFPVYCLPICTEYEVEGSRPRGRPKRTWREVVQKDCQARNLNKEDGMDHSTVSGRSW